MRNLISAAALLILPLAGGVAHAGGPSMSNTDFVRASVCLTHANLRILQGDRPDLSALSERVNFERTVKPDEILKRANNQSRRVLINAAQADTPGEVEKMRARRDRVCAPYLPPATTQAAAG